MKILLSAYGCNPQQGSEPAVGWSWLASIKDRHDVHVLTARHQRQWIETEVSSNAGEFVRVRFHYVEPPLWAYDNRNRFWRWQANKPLLVPIYHWYYQRWLRAAYHAAVELHRRIHFDLVHQLTLVGFRFPGHLWRLGIPFVWGPIGGLENTPWHLLPSMGPRGAAYYAARNVVNSAHKGFLRGPRKAFAAAGPGVIAATSSIRQEIKTWYGVDSEVICEVGLPPSRTPSVCSERSVNAPLRIAWSGLHVWRKALPILLRALASLDPKIAWRLDIFGDGPCGQRWRTLASDMGLQRKCVWHGRVSRADALAGLRRAHVFVITSLQDLTSTVLVEALANGVPVICPDHCGFTDVINDECGIKLPIRSTGEFQQGLAQTIMALASNEQWRRHLAAGALRRAQDFSWEAKADAIDRVYERVMTSRGVQRTEPRFRASPVAVK